MKTGRIQIWKLIVAIYCLLFAIFGLLDALGVTPSLETMVGEVTVVQITMVPLLTAFFIKYVFKLKLCKAIFMLSLLFMVTERNIAYLCGVKSDNLINNWLLLFYTLLICIGLSLILPKKWHKHKRGGMVYNAHRFGDNSIYIDCESFTDRYVDNDLGSTTICFENTEGYTGGGRLHLDNNLGSIVVRVPENWVVACQIDNNLGSVTNRAIDGTGPTLAVDGDNNLGSIVIQRVK